MADEDVYKLHLAPLFLEGGNEGGGVLSVFLAIFSLKPRSRQSLTFVMMRLHFLRSKVVGSSKGVSGTPFA
jgi:hypothetical protein